MGAKLRRAADKTELGERPACGLTAMEFFDQRFRK